MRKPKVENKYNLKVSDVKDLKILDDSKICEPLFWRNNVIKAWCISENTAKSNNDHRYGTYNDYWLGIYDKVPKRFKSNIRVSCSSFGGMCNYKFEEFFNPKDIENEIDLEIQEKLLSKLNELIDNGILGI